MKGLSVLKEIAPEIFDIVEQRYIILRTVRYMAPVGRRLVAQKLGKSERVIRRELDFLRDRGFLIGTNSGYYLSDEGVRVLKEVQEYIRGLYGLATLEDELGGLLGVKVIIVPGDSDTDPVVKQDLAKATARFLRKILKPGDILAVTGGTTLSQVAESFPPDRSIKDITVVPARGGLGEDVNIQANSIAARLAHGLGGTYRLLHAPDNVDPDLMDNIINEPHIREVIALGKKAQVLLHGIGTAEEMARRRGVDEERLKQLLAAGAVGEAFGYYFDAQGQIVYATTSIGLRLEDLANIPMIVAVGGGSGKAGAVLSVISTGYCNVCITDEGVARRLIKILKNREE